MIGTLSCIYFQTHSGRATSEGHSYQQSEYVTSSERPLDACYRDRDEMAGFLYHVNDVPHT